MLYRIEKKYEITSKFEERDEVEVLSILENGPEVQ